MPGFTVGPWWHCIALLALLALPGALPAQQELASLGYARGSETAPVTVVEFGDFGCSACRKFALEGYPPLHEEFVATGKVRWIYVPFLLGLFPNAPEAARAAECAAEQDAFWEIHDLLFERQAEWKRLRNPASVLQALRSTAEARSRPLHHLLPGRRRPGPHPGEQPGSPA